MRTFKFNKCEHEEWGGDGWLLVGAPSTYWPLGGMGIAHDLLEHTSTDDGSVRDEVMALGAALFTRGEGGYWSGSYHGPGKHIGSDLPQLAIQFDGLGDLPEPGRTTRLDEEVEEWIEAACKDARQELIDEYASETNRSSVSSYLTRCRGWLRKGFRAARRRYKNRSACELSHLFKHIEVRADELLNHAEFEQLVIQLDISRCDAKLYLEYPAEEEW